jgi:hypothetical protein
MTLDDRPEQRSATECVIFALKRFKLRDDQRLDKDRGFADQARLKARPDAASTSSATSFIVLPAGRGVSPLAANFLI